MTGKFAGCIEDAVKAGDLDAETAGDVRQAYADAFEAASESLGPVDADRQAGQAVLTALEAAALRQKRLRALSIRARRAALENLAEFKTRRGYKDVQALGGNGGKPPKDGWVQGGEPPKRGPYKVGHAAADYLKELVDGQGGLAGAPGASVRGRYQAIRGQLDAKMADLIDKFETRTGFDAPGRATLENIVREAFGEETGDRAAKVLAESWAGASEHARLLFNAAGGEIGHLEKWGLPQSHDPLAVRNAGRAGWVEATAPLLDRSRMIDRVTELPFTEKRLRAVLGETWDSIVTGGLDARAPGEQLGKGKLADRRAEHRFLVFKDADAWMAYQRDFGRADPFAAMMNHLDGMARDTARLQVLGPNPDHQFDWLARFAEREGVMEAKAEGGHPKADADARQGVDTARTMYQTFTGTTATPYGRNIIAAEVGAGLRSLLSGVQLGSAVISDLTSNPVFAAQARAFTGLSKTGDFKAWLGHVTRPEVRHMAHRSGFIVEGARTMLASSAQDALRMHTVGGKIAAGLNAFSRRLPVAVMKAQGLSGNIAASRWAFQHEFMGALADRADKSIAQLLAGDAEDRMFGQTLQARGFTEDDWAKVRATPPETPQAGAAFISPTAVAKAHGDELGWRVSEMIERQTRLAVPEPVLWARAHLVGDTRPGTVWGELRRSGAAYRSFTVTQTFLWAREFAARAQQSPAWGLTAAAAAAPLLISLTVGGGLALLLKDLVKGNDPRPATTPQFWGAALLQGGGLGILGDFFYAAQARNGKSSALTSMGPGAAFLSDAFDLTVGNALETAKGVQDGKPLDRAIHDAHPERDATRFLARYSPLSSLWFTRAAWDRMVIDQLQKQLDPDAAAEFQRQARRLQRDTGQGQWWPEGAPLPARAPDASGVATVPHR